MSDQEVPTRQSGDDDLSAPAYVSEVAPSPVIDSQELLQGNAEVLINHQGSLYRLRLTRSGKLILHK